MGSSQIPEMYGLGTGRGRVSIMPRTITLSCGLLLAAFVMSHGAAAHPVHEIQVVAAKPGFTPRPLK